MLSLQGLMGIASLHAILRKHSYAERKLCNRLTGVRARRAFAR